MILVTVLLLGVALGGCGTRGSMSANAGSHTPGMTEYESQMLYTDSPSYTRYDLR